MEWFRSASFNLLSVEILTFLHSFSKVDTFNFPETFPEQNKLVMLIRKQKYSFLLNLIFLTLNAGQSSRLRAYGVNLRIIYLLRFKQIKVM